MITAALVSSALALAQAWAPIGIPETIMPAPTHISDVAYDALAEGKAEEAIQRIELLLAGQPDDPSLLINLGAAYLLAGDYARASEAYRRAAASEDRYRLELADGSWVDSRLAARRALQALEGSLMASR